ncbi:Carboxypeptidase A4 [Actinomortierella wolfii]|nr:Carboxypeptidase A4 [Actinomortierella wolfii]
MRPVLTVATVSLACCALLAQAFPYRPFSHEDMQEGQQQLPMIPHRNYAPVRDNNAFDGNTANGYARFDNHRVYRVEVTSMDELKKLEALVEAENLDLWTNLRIGTVDVRVPADKVALFEEATTNFFTGSGAGATVMIPNLQDLIPDEAPASFLGPRQSPTTNWNFTDNSFWTQYHDLATLNNFTETMIRDYPQLCKRVSIGKTYEGREVFGMVIHGYKDQKKPRRKPHKCKKKNSRRHHYKKMKKHQEKKNKKSWDLFDWIESWLDDKDDDDSTNDVDLEMDMDDYINVDDDDFEELVEEDDSLELDDRFGRLWGLLDLPKLSRKPSKPRKNPKGVVIHGGQHAREWIGPAVVTYLAKELILGYHKNKRITRILDQYEFTIVPVLNVDGYAYTWEHNRMWRKNREPTSVPFCPGVDPNRNWGYKWNTGGSSGNPCNEGYHGPEAFSAAEPRMMADYIKKRGNVLSYIDFHSYSQLWMSPFGADCEQTPKDEEDILEGSIGAAKALHDVHGKKFVVGSVCNIIYQASGGSLDWTYAEGKVKYSYAVELRDTGRHGFLLPAEEILPSGEETTAAVVYLMNFIRKREKQWGNK